MGAVPYLVGVMVNFRKCLASLSGNPEIRFVIDDCECCPQSEQSVIEIREVRTYERGKAAFCSASLSLSL